MWVHQLKIDSKNVNAGIYFVKMSVNGEQITKKLIISKL
ncbi:MAG: T9SS type A sorting domain-containing protein [Bacteroidetes bacterium]|nr:T9SS type A sorting domain-containing protein [Bacteroidota bacterium]